ncbi:uncharacterized protein LOC123520126 isoform X2 [Portunus trituberculatus]|uniref:uncharacterized protein LOC123520126 isoform X2 n=1 Tax=Portunus trituberculatus TaxID=210409 RepID=UPI001E1CCD39|nr:uncharacterized protein LOC123520126 isoform X2 [Portunus trituberculatus]
MCWSVGAVLMLVTVAGIPAHSQQTSAASSRLATAYTIRRTDDSTQTFLRVGSPPSTRSLTVALQTDLTSCGCKVTGNYSGRVLQVTGGYTGDALKVVALRDRRVEGVGSVEELLGVAWRPEEEEMLVITAPRTNLSLASGHKGQAEQWWRLWLRGGGEERVKASSGHSSPPQPDKEQDAARTESGRGVEVRTHFYESIFGIFMDSLVAGERRGLLNLTFTPYTQEHWQVSLHVPVISAALEWETKLWKNQGKQYRQVNGEVRSTKSDVSLDFVHFEQEKQGEETPAMDDSGEAGCSCDAQGCGDGGVKKPHEKSPHNFYSDCESDLRKEWTADQNEVCNGRGHKSEDLKQNYPDSVMVNIEEKCSKEAECDGPNESISSEAVQEIAQKITSRVLSLSSNMKTFVSPDGGHWIRILLRTHLAFCPRLSWNLNQIFRFNGDWTGWEYVVNTWEWGNMVVKAEWGVSLLQWYQKTFSFSFDQAAALPSTQLVLDFRDWWSYKAWLKWPVLASSLAASLTLGPDRHTLLVKKVDEFLGEDAGEVVVRVVARHIPAGLVVTFLADTATMKELHDIAVAVLAQAMESPDLCGEVPDHATVHRFLQDLFGQSPASLWANLLQEARHLLLGSGFEADLHHLLEVFREEMGTEGAGLWEVVWTVLERAGLLMSRGEELEIAVPSEWITLVQGCVTWAVMEGPGQCEGSTLMGNLLEALVVTLGRGGSG